MGILEKAGLVSLTKNDLPKRHVAASIIDALLSGKSKSLDPTSLAQAIGISTDQVRDALEDNAGLLSFSIDEDWENVGTFRVVGMTVQLEMVQPVLSSTTVRPDLEIPREKTGHHRVEIAGVDTRCSVIPIRNEDETLTGWVNLNIDRYLDVSPAQDGSEYDAFHCLLNKEFDTEEKAWQYWDNWVKERQEESDVVLWFNSLAPSVDQETNKPLPIIVDDPTFHFLCKELGLDQVPPSGILDHIEASEMWELEHIAHLCPPNGEGRHWPGCDVLGPDPKPLKTKMDVVVNGAKEKVDCESSIRFIPQDPAFDRVIAKLGEKTAVTYVPTEESIRDWIDRTFAKSEDIAS